MPTKDALSLWRGIGSWGADHHHGVSKIANMHATINYSSMMLLRPPTSNSNPKKLLVRPDAPVAEGSWQTAPAAPGSCRGRNWPIVYLIRLKNPLNRPVSLHVFALCRACLFFLGVFFFDVGYIPRVTLPPPLLLTPKSLSFWGLRCGVHTNSLRHARYLATQKAVAEYMLSRKS